MEQKVLKHNIPYPVTSVYPYFSDINKFVSIHPVIYKCDPVSIKEYKLYEKLSLGLFKVSFSYIVIMETTAHNVKVVMFSIIRKGVTLRLTFDFTTTPGGTEIIETVEFSGPFGIGGFFLNFLTKVHRKIVDNLIQTLS
jgi:hypothetical protein